MATAKSRNRSRRAFIGKLGAVSTALAATAGAVVAATPGRETPIAGDPSLRAALLEEEKALRRLHQTFEQAMDKGLHEDVIAMFADDAQVVFAGGVFDQREHGVTRLYRERFPAGKTGRRMEQAPGFELAAEEQQDSVDVAPDRVSATAVFPYSIQVGMPFETESSLAAMARLHGEGVRTWWEGGVYRIAYRKDAAGAWKISRLAYDTLSRADWRTEKRYAQPIFVAPLSTRFPVDPQGPDDLA
jgi:carotenoid cleavage dioxygenase